MFDNPYLYFAVLGGLILLSAFFSGSETALLSLDTLRIKYLVHKKRRGAQQLEAIRQHPDQLLSAILIGNNLVNIAASVFATALFVQLFGDHGELVTILLLTPVILILAEIAPKTFAAHNPERVSFLVLGPIRMVMLLLKPLIWVVTGISRLMTRFTSSEAERGLISEDEIRAMISVGEASGVVGRDKRRMLHGIFDLSQIRARDVMIPRTEVVGIEVSTPFAEALEIAQQARHSRFPVYEGSLDEVVGVIHSKDILKFVGRPEEFSLRDEARPPYFVPESKRINTLLQSFRQKHIHLAMVVDEYGGVEGIVTLEDIVEEIVGDIQDEYDTEEVLIREMSFGRYMVDGSVSLRVINQKFGLQLSEEHANTLAGFLLHCLGSIPRQGDCCEAQGVSFTVRRVVDRRVEGIEMVLPDTSPRA
ncbi:MAG: CNNM domain-containing protein [Syntrophotaleaceae bacterium]